MTAAERQKAYRHRRDGGVLVLSITVTPAVIRRCSSRCRHAGCAKACPRWQEARQTKQAAQRAPRGLYDDAAIRALVRREIDAAVRDLLDSVGRVIVEERAAHRKEVRRLRFALRDLRRAVHKQQAANKARLVAPD